MKLRHLKELANRLREQLAPIYIVAGDEPLQIEEACDGIRAAARQQGYTDRTVHHVDVQFPWENILAEANTLSLFANKQIIEIRVPFDKIGNGKKILQAYAQNLPPDTVLLLITSRISKSQESSKWFTALEKQGIYVQVWPVEPQQMHGWIDQRLKRSGLGAEPGATALMADLLQGNLLAAAQTIEQLILLAKNQTVTLDTVRNTVADHARYDVFALADTALAGDPGYALRIHNGLIAEGTEPTIMLWALARELRLTNHMAGGLRHGATIDQVIDQIASAHRQIPFLLKKKKTSYQGFIRRHGEGGIRKLISQAARIDRALKGAEPERSAKDELLGLVMAMAGQPTPATMFSSVPWEGNG